MTEFQQNYEDLINLILNHPTTQISSNLAEIQKQMQVSFHENSHDSSPRLSDHLQFLEEKHFSPDIAYDKEPFSSNLDQSFQLFPKYKQKSTENQNHISNSSLVVKRQKNSNAIKKIGRIILDNLREYSSGRTNSAVQSMLKLLSKDSKVGRNEVKKRDKFNTFHLRALFGGKDQKTIKQNLKTTRRILSKNLRKNILLSSQITPSHKALYLNTMKCSALRCLHQDLAVRLQMSL